MYLGYQEGKIKFYTNSISNLEFYPNIKWEETQDEYILNDDMTEYIKKPENYEEILKQKERERLDKIILSKAIFETAIYKDKGITLEEISNIVNDKEFKISLGTNEIIRGGYLVQTVQKVLGYSDDTLDYLFENKSFPLSEG